MDFGWLYILVAAAGVAGAALLERVVKQPAARRRAWGWLSILAGAAFLLIYLLAPGGDGLALTLGLVAAAAGGHALEAARLYERIGVLEDEVRGSGSSGNARPALPPADARPAAAEAAARGVLPVGTSSGPAGQTRPARRDDPRPTAS